MQGKSTKIYFKRLLADGHSWQYTDIAGDKMKPRFYFTSMQWTILFASAFLSPLLLKGFNKEFVSYTLTALSIFVGLFLTLILTAFDKFNNLKIENPTITQRRYIKTRKNFFQQFTALTAYAIIISLLCIVLLGLVSLSDATFSDSVLNYPIASLNSDNVLRFLKVFFKTLYNAVIMYFLLDFLVLVLYAVTSMHSYMRVEFNRN